MSAYMTEDEQIELIKKWWNKWGNVVLTSILVFVLCFTGYRWWNSRELRLASQASMAYQSMLVSVSRNDVTGIEAQGNYLRNTFPRTAYAKLGALLIARVNVYAKKYDKAIAQLSWVAKTAKNSGFKQVARIRLARVYLQQKNYKEALSALNTVADKTFMPVIAGVKGDIYQAQGKPAQARNAYKTALKDLPANAPIVPLLTMKMNNISVPNKSVANKINVKADKKA